MKFDDYITWRIEAGPVDKDGAYGYQCMDLYNDYCELVLELYGDTGAPLAKDILNNPYVQENFERIDNYPEFIPHKRRCCSLDRWKLWTCCYLYRTS